MAFPISISPKKISIKTFNNFQNFPIIGQLMTCSYNIFKNSFNSCSTYLTWITLKSTREKAKKSRSELVHSIAYIMLPTACMNI